MFKVIDAIDNRIRLYVCREGEFLSLGATSGDGEMVDIWLGDADMIRLRDHLTVCINNKAACNKAGVKTKPKSIKQEIKELNRYV